MGSILTVFLFSKKKCGVEEFFWSIIARVQTFGKESLESNFCWNSKLSEYQNILTFLRKLQYVVCGQNLRVIIPLVIFVHV